MLTAVDNLLYSRCFTHHCHLCLLRVILVIFACYETYCHSYFASVKFNCNRLFRCKTYCEKYLDISSKKYLLDPYP